MNALIGQEAAYTTDPKILEQYARHPDYHVRLNVAKNENTPTHVVHLLANDSRGIVRFQVTKRANIESFVLAKLLKDDDHRVILGAISNPKTSFRNLWVLFTEEASDLDANQLEGLKKALLVNHEEELREKVNSLAETDALPSEWVLRSLGLSFKF